MAQTPPYTTATALLEALTEAGVRHVFGNLGSDHPALVETFAHGGPGLPDLVLCPHETVALSAAHAYAAVTGTPQAVLVHVDAGTQNLGGALGNAARGRVPVLIFAGMAPHTQDGELPGGRNEFIHWIQDVRDQRGIVRGYTKYDNEVRSGRTVKSLVHRALQIARSEPAGPVYLTAVREVLEETIAPYSLAADGFPPLSPAALGGALAAEIADALTAARHPLIVTSYLGRHPEAVADLTRLAELLAVPVLESVPTRVNFPADHPLHLGYQWTTAGQNPHLAAADVVLVLDSDVPWIPLTNRPSPGARVYAIDIDPLKLDMAYHHIAPHRVAAAGTGPALRQIAALVAEREIDTALVEARRAEIAAAHHRRRAGLNARERPDGGVITPAYLTACVRDALTGRDALVLNEAVINFQVVSDHLRANRPGMVLAAGGFSLGWAGGGVVGAKLAAPERTVVALVGDGSYLFGVPASAQWTARRYGAPALTVIYDNRGWLGPKFSTLALHPEGVLAAGAPYPGRFEPELDLPGIAVAAGGAHGATVDDPAALPTALADALAAVDAGRSAVLSVRIPPV